MPLVQTGANPKERSTHASAVPSSTATKPAGNPSGSFNRAEDATGLAAIYAEIDAAGARQGRTTSWRPRTPLTLLPAAGFVVLVLVAYVLRLVSARLGRRRRPVPA